MGPGGRKPRARPGLGEPDRQAFEDGYRRVCGVDEVGRGPLAGPVVAAAVVFPPDGWTELVGLGDSKTLSPAVRQGLVPRIREVALGVGVGVAAPEEIDRLNILRASLLAMARAVTALPLCPDFVLVDGTHPIPSLRYPQTPLVKGDARSACVAAASVVAKEHRDCLMREAGECFPGYGFEAHMGYPTEAHREALLRLGPCPLHRRSFRGVRELLGLSTQLGLFGAP